MTFTLAPPPLTRLRRTGLLACCFAVATGVTILFALRFLTSAARMIDGLFLLQLLAFCVFGAMLLRQLLRRPVIATRITAHPDHLTLQSPALGVFDEKTWRREEIRAIVAAERRFQPRSRHIVLHLRNGRSFRLVGAQPIPVAEAIVAGLRRGLRLSESSRRDDPPHRAYDTAAWA